MRAMASAFCANAPGRIASHRVAYAVNGRLDTRVLRPIALPTIA
jgi:hypothetical protein